MRHILVIIAFVLLAPAASATVLIPAEFREIVRGSEMIAYGRVVDVRPAWVDGRRQIETLVTMEVAAWFKGNGDRTITFKVPGGELGRYRTVMIGAPIFAPGDEAVLCLNTRGAALPYVFGLNQGVFRVRVDTRSGRRVIAPPALMATGDSPEILRRGSLARQPIALEEFGARVRTVMREGQ